MKWLLWREARQNQMILYTGLVLLLLPYVVAEVTRVIMGYGFITGIVVHNCSLFSLALSQLTVVLLAGNAFAGERANRSAEYIAFLPLKRSQLLASKLYLSLIVFAITWGVNLLLYFSSNLMHRKEPMALLIIAMTGVAFYGVAWLISSFQSSPTFAIGGGLVAPLIVAMTLTLIVENMESRTEELRVFFQMCYVCISGILGTVSFGIGTVYYLQRKEP